MDGRPYFSLFSDETRFSRLLPRSAKGWKPYLDRQSLGAGGWVSLRVGGVGTEGGDGGWPLGIVASW